MESTAGRYAGQHKEGHRHDGESVRVSVTAGCQAHSQLSPLPLWDCPQAPWTAEWTARGPYPCIRLALPIETGQPGTNQIVSLLRNCS